MIDGFLKVQKSLESDPSVQPEEVKKSLDYYRNNLSTVQITAFPYQTNDPDPDFFPYQTNDPDPDYNSNGNGEKHSNKKTSGCNQQ
jgi:hypothetical protein